MQPDVSVVTRYSRQDTLARALQSLVSQRKDQLQPSLELILVDALGGGIQPSVPEDIGKFQWVSTGTPMSRPVALAAGIAAARGVTMIGLIRRTCKNFFSAFVPPAPIIQMSLQPQRAYD